MANTRVVRPVPPEPFVAPVDCVTWRGADGVSYLDYITIGDLRTTDAGVPADAVYVAVLNDSGAYEVVRAAPAGFVMKSIPMGWPA